MNKPLRIFPNKTIQVEVLHPDYFKNLIGKLNMFCDQDTNLEHIDTYKITSSSFWKGLNLSVEEECNFIQVLKDYSDSIPETVLADIKNWNSKFGVISLVGDDCLKVRSKDVLQEIKNNSRLKNIVYAIEDDMVFFSNTTVSELQKIFESEFDHPIKIHRSKIRTFVMDVFKDTYTVKASDALTALRTLYNKHKQINEMDLKEKLNHRKGDVSDEDINKYLKMIWETNNINIKVISHYATTETVKF